MAEREHIINKIQELLDAAYGKDEVKRDYLVATGETGWRIVLDAALFRSKGFRKEILRYGTLYIIPQKNNIVFRWSHSKGYKDENEDDPNEYDILAVHDYDTILTINPHINIFNELDETVNEYFVNGDKVLTFVITGTTGDPRGTYPYFITKHEANENESCGCLH